MVNSGEVLIYTPLSVTAEPPSLVTDPTQETELSVILLTVKDVTTGFEGVVKEINSPYDIPALLMAYARTVLVSL